MLQGLNREVPERLGEPECVKDGVPVGLMEGDLESVPLGVAQREAAAAQAVRAAEEGRAGALAACGVAEEGRCAAEAACAGAVRAGEEKERELTAARAAAVAEVAALEKAKAAREAQLGHELTALQEAYAQCKAELMQAESALSLARGEGSARGDAARALQERIERCEEVARTATAACAAADLMESEMMVRSK